jgi:hypothetical protein
MELATNSREVLEAARESWASFPRAFAADPLRLRVVAADAPDGMPGLPSYHAQGSLLAIVADRANFAICDLRRAFAFAWFTPAAVADRDYLRFYFLEAAAYSILTSLHLTSIHASCVALDGSGILLCGPTGAGKSSLAYACARHGFTFVSDDAIALLRRSGERKVIGKPMQMRFRGNAGELLPEMRGLLARKAASGKPTIEVRTGDIPGVRTALQCAADHVVFLHRGIPGPARLEPLPAEEARIRLIAELPVLDPGSYGEQLASLDKLLKNGAWELRYSDLDSAVRRLETLARHGVAR